MTIRIRLPGSRYFLPPPPLRCGEHIMKKAAGSLGIGIVPIRRAVLTQITTAIRSAIIAEPAVTAAMWARSSTRPIT